MLNYLGMSRDTLRFYEEKGLLNPKKNDENNYRNYDIFDVYTIMIIDFYKKRGMKINQIKALLKESDISELQNLLKDKKNELESMIYNQQCMLKRIEETQEFSKGIKDNLNIFTVKPLPLYIVNGEVSDFIAVEEYENVLDVINSTNSDMLSQIMRYISFNENGVISTKMFIVETTKEKKEHNYYLQYPKCLYTIVEEVQPQNEQINIMDRMHKVSYEYANTHGLKLIGEAFAIIRLVTCKTNKIHSYMEIFIPFE